MKAEFGKHKKYDIQFFWKPGLFSDINSSFHFNPEGQREPISDSDWQLINENWEHFEKLGFYSGQLGTFINTVREINKRGKNIQFGTLVEGEFREVKT